MKTKLIVFDIDGTLVNDKKQMLPVTKETLETLHNKGVLLGIASGRPIDEKLTNKHKNWKLSFQFDVFIGMNGGELWNVKSDEHYSYNELSKETIKEIIELLEPFDLNPFVYRKGFMLCKKLDKLMQESSIRNDEPSIEANDISDLWKEENHKVLYRFLHPERMPEIIKYVNDRHSDKYYAFATGPIMMEVQDPKNNKGVALRKYCESTNIDLKDVIAFGDSTNDNVLLLEAGLGIAVNNASEDTKKASDLVLSLTNNEDAVGIYLKEMLKNNNL